MSSAIVVWLVIFGIAALLFFGTAAVIAVLGAQDLRELLSRSHTHDPASKKGA